MTILLSKIFAYAIIPRLECKNPWHPILLDAMAFDMILNFCLPKSVQIAISISGKRLFFGESEGYPQTRLDLYEDFSMNVEAIPYYLISDFTAYFDAETQQIHMQCSVTPNTDERLNGVCPAITSVRGFVSTSTIVNSVTTCVKNSSGRWPAFSGTSTQDIPIEDYHDAYINNFRDYGYCRMAFELEGIPDYYLYTPVIKVEGLPVKEWGKL